MDFYYFDQFNQKQGPVSKEELKDLAARGEIEPNTPMETSSGHSGTAGQIPELFIAHSRVSMPPLNRNVNSRVGVPPFNGNTATEQQYQQQGSLFCSNCGSPVHPQAVACPRCGVPPRAERNYCMNCGAALNSPKQIVCVQCGFAIRNINYSSSPGEGGIFFDADALGTGFWDVITKKYVMINGRARRREYWMFSLLQFLVIWIPMIIGFAFIGASENGDNPALAIIGGTIMFIGVILALALILPALTLSIRRLHDAGFSGWFWFVQLIPYVGGLVFLVFMVLDSQRGDNKYGPNPKGIY